MFMFPLRHLRRRRLLPARLHHLRLIRRRAFRLGFLVAALLCVTVSFALQPPGRQRPGNNQPPDQAQPDDNMPPPDQNGPPGQGPQGQGPQGQGPQGQGQPPQGGPGQQGPANQRGQNAPPPDPTKHPLFLALDLNHDGVISADEIAKAADSLKTLANAQGTITAADIRKRLPQGGPNNRGGQGGPGGQRGGPPGGPGAGGAAAQPKKITEPVIAGIKSPFDANVKVSFTKTWMIVESDGIPTHKTGDFPNATNPNHIEKQNYRFIIPREPKIADKPTPTPMGPIGVAINGIPFYNAYNAEGNDAVQGPFAEVFDSCCGHPDQLGRYHYHQYPTCVKSPFKDPPGEHSPLIGYAFDGFPIYGPNGDDGKPPTDLDECNGRTDPIRGYHYHVTSKFPYIIGAYKGVVDFSNFDQRGNFQGGRTAPYRPAPQNK